MKKGRPLHDSVEEVCTLGECDASSADLVTSISQKILETGTARTRTLRTSRQASDRRRYGFQGVRMEAIMESLRPWPRALI